MNTYEIIKERPESELKRLMQTGLLSANTLVYKDIYETYSRLKQSGMPTMLAYSTTGSAYGMGEDNIRHIIAIMRKEI